MKRLKLYFLACLSCLSFTHVQSTQTFQLKAQQFSIEDKKQICRMSSRLCDDTKILKSTANSGKNFWVMGRHHIAQFKQQPQGLILQQEWEIPISEHQDNEQVENYIYPKIFEMGNERYAIAVIHTFSEMYSGGGARIERADFYELPLIGKPRQFIKNYPFSLNRIIRACFSEQDYKMAKEQCHDEDNLTVDIQLKKPMLWQLRYRYYFLRSPASDSKQPSYRDTRHIMINLNDPIIQPDIPIDWNYQGIE